MAPPLLLPTPSDRLVDAAGHPYFLWDAPGMTLPDLLERLEDPDPAERGWWVGKVMAQARPDDVLTLVRPADIVRLWPHLERNLGRTRPFWTWLVGRWKQLALVELDPPERLPAALER